MKSSELSNGENRIALRQLLQNRKLRHLGRHKLGSRWKLQKMAPENLSIGAFYNITKNQDNPIKTVGRDSFLSLKTPKNTSFKGSPSPQGSHSPYILGDTTCNICPSLIEIGSKTGLRKILHKQTEDRHYENNGHLAVNQFRQTSTISSCRHPELENVSGIQLVLLKICDYIFGWSRNLGLYVLLLFVLISIRYSVL